MLIVRVGKIAKEKGISIQELADRAGIAYNTAKALYRGHSSRIDLPILERICQVLEVEPGALFEQVEDDYPLSKIEEDQYVAVTS